MAHAFTSIATITEAIARILESHQVNPREFFTGVGLEAEPYHDPDARIPVEKMAEIWEQARNQTGNPCIGFDVGMAFRSSNLHAVGYAWLASANLREALERFVRYQKLISTGLDASVEVVGEQTNLLLHNAVHVPQYGVDACFCCIVVMCRDVSHPEFTPRKVCMQCAEPECAPRLREFFGCPIQFGAPDNRISFSSASLDESLARNNPAMAQVSEEVARNYLAHLDKSDVLAQAWAALVSHLPDGEPSRRRLADTLHMSERTLARRLQEREYTFTSLVDEIRGHLAKDHLRQSRFSVMDISFLLGFSDQSNFARAFKRWTGHTPSEFRQLH